MYAEDLDLAWRLHRAGWATRYEPRAVADHESAAATTRRFGDELTARWQRSTYGHLARRRGAPYARTVALLNTAGAAVPWAWLALRARAQPELAWRRDVYKGWARLHAEALRPGTRLENLR
jgi:GT2 family glycosyltransferase